MFFLFCFFQSGLKQIIIVKFLKQFLYKILAHTTFFSCYKCALHNSILWMNNIYKAGLHLMQLYLL